MAESTEKPAAEDAPKGNVEAQLPPEPPGNPRILYLALISFFFCFAIWALYAPFGPFFMEWYGLSASQVLILVAIPALLGSVVRIPMGILADKYGARIVFSILLLFVVLPLIGAIFVDSYIMFLICGLFFGMSGTSFIVGITHVSAWYPQSKQGTALGIYGVGNVGTILATIFVPLLIVHVFGGNFIEKPSPAPGSAVERPVEKEMLKDVDTFTPIESEEGAKKKSGKQIPPKIMIGSIPGWHFIFGIYAIPALVLGIVYWFMTSEPPRRHKAKSFGEIFSVYKSSGLAWVFSYLYWMTFGGFVAFSLFSPTYFYDRWDIDKVQASMVFTTIFVIITALIRSLGGVLSDRIDPRKILMVTFGVSILVLVIMTMEINFIVQLTCLYILGFCCGIGNACVFKLIPTYFTAVGAVGGLAGALGGVGGFFMPILMGLIKGATGSYKYGFGIWVVIAAGALVIVL
ncbi:MAG: NarK/NasA family nitrate transporter, partial [Planctomycetes bacterium]|nr:NarK/NasA family nitrate transporter [Planctomycetota bacterium]